MEKDPILIVKVTKGNRRHALHLKLSLFRGCFVSFALFVLLKPCILFIPLRFNKPKGKRKENTNHQPHKVKHEESISFVVCCV